MFDPDLMKRLQNQQQQGKPDNQGKPNFPPKTRQDDQQYKRQEDKGDARRNRGWNVLVRLSVLFACLIAMYISAEFSVDGFKFSVSPDQAWVAWGIAFILIAIQIAWQKFPDNLTVAAIAVVSYTYGIGTNVLGILAVRGGYNGDPSTLLVPLVFGIMLEAFPEPFLGWAVSGDTSSDPLKRLIDRFGG